MSSQKQDAELLVRQRAKFRCENCGSFSRFQYSHIIPNRDEGEYNIKNLLYFCYPCHRKYEVAMLPKGSRKYNALVQEMREIRDKRKSFNVIEDLLTYPGNHIQFNVGNNEIINSPFIIRTTYSIDSKPFDLLNITTQDNKININAWVFSKDTLILSILNNNLTTHDNNFWDVEVKGNNDILFVSKHQDAFLELTSSAENIVRITGKFYFKEAVIELTDEQGLIITDKLGSLNFNRCKANNSEFIAYIDPILGNRVQF